MKMKILLLALAVFASTSLFAVTHGSIIKKNAPLDVVIDHTWAQYFPAGAVVDFRAVTIGGKLWAKVVGTGYELDAAAWASQVRIFNPTKTEISVNNFPASVTSTPATLTTTVTAYPYTTIDQISVVQAHHDAYNGTATWDYDVNATNSGLTDDTQKPVLTKADIGTQIGSMLQVSCSASDNSGDYFYLVTDVSNNTYFVSFTDDFTITGLDPAITYSFSVVAADFSGNESSGLTTAIKATNNSKMSFTQNEGSIVINSPEIIQSVKLYSINGQLITSKTSTNTIETSNLVKGIYVLKVKDIQGTINDFKVAIK